MSFNHSMHSMHSSDSYGTSHPTTSMNNMFSSSPGFSGFSFQDLFKPLNLSDGLREHLVAIYRLVAFMLLTATIGSIATYKSAPHPWIWSIIQFGAMVWFAFASPASLFLTFSLRSVLLVVISTAVGALLNPLLKMAIQTNEMIIPIALGSTLILFAAFSLVAMKVDRLTVLYYYAPIAMIAGLLSFYALISSLFGTNLIPSLIWTAFGMVLSCFFIILDTQAIALRFEQGEDDVQQHALLIFLDFIKLFVRVLHIVLSFTKNDKNSNSNKKKSSD